MHLSYLSTFILNHCIPIPLPQEKSSLKVRYSDPKQNVGNGITERFGKVRVLNKQREDGIEKYLENLK